MKRDELYNIRKTWLDNNVPYKMIHWTRFDYNILHNIMYLYRAGRGNNKSYNDVIIMGDTETSKKFSDGRIAENHVVAWTISIRSFDRNIVTLWGHRPDTMIECIEMIMNNMEGELTYMYFHNLAYDWIFLRKFFFRSMGEPIKQLNTKSHYPISIEFNTGLILKDSLILAQRKLEKWAEDMNVEHKKSVGKWDYDKIRNQKEVFSDDELEYIEHDTLAGVECIQKLMNMLHKRIYSMPYTATGIPREEVRNRGKEHNAHDKYLAQCPTWEQQQKLEMVYHGGYTHGNRHFIGMTMGKDEGESEIECRDFSSSYPFTILSEKFPTEKFTPLEEDLKLKDIVNLSKEYAIIFKLILYKPKLKNDNIPMPALQFSKCVKCVNPILDNGRILACSYCEIYITEIDACVLYEQYDISSGHLCTEIEFAHKNYLPRWLTDYVYELYTQKCTLKKGDPVLYALKKAELNSIYGMFCQRPVKLNLKENYKTGEYIAEIEDMEELYNKHTKKYTSVLPYQWGCYVTSYAFRNLFELGKCVDYENGGQWLYSDTDSCYAMKWNEEKLEKYNQKCKAKLLANGYGAVEYDGKEYWLGIAEKDSVYTEYRYLGAKRYAGRSKEDGELHITVAGVPKKGSICLNDNLDNFKKGTIFPGTVTGKKLHTYFFIDGIYMDANGNLTGDSVDLSPCDYLMDSIETLAWEELFKEEIEVEEFYE